MRLLILILALQTLTSAANAACDQTLSVGANVVTALKNAAAGSTVCLNAGSYGSINISGVTKTAPVTLQSTSGQSASASFGIELSDRIVIRSMTVNWMYIHNLAKNITVSENTFKGQLLMNLGGNGGANYGNANILIDKNSFDAISVDPNAYEGRVQIISELPCGVKITNNHFGGPGESDGIQNGANGVVIGPGNVFDGIRQLNYGRHVDAYQGYGQSNTTLTGNYFVNGDTYIMTPDGGENEVVTNNVFVGDGNYWGKIQNGSHKNDVFAHNTLINLGAGWSRKKENPTNSSGVVVRDNIMIGAEFTTAISDTPGSGCTNCTFTHNQFSTSGSAMGTNNIIGLPTFTGGSSPTTWAGYKLTTTSMGYKAATDGLDMGTTVYGPSAVTPPPPSRVIRSTPTLIRVQR